MAGNKALQKAMKAKEDEFYTQLTDIEAELQHYREQFKDQVVFCNCDDPYESNFFKYFAMNFNHLGLKKLVATSYAGSPITGQQLPLLEAAGLKDTPPPRQPYKVEITEVPDLNEDGAIDLTDVEYLMRSDANVMTPLEGDGDFRSAECVELLKEADIVVTNPPFSQWRTFVAQLIEYEKKFLIIGSQNAITYKEIFPLLKDDKMWLGYRNGDMAFRVPDDYEERATRFWVDEEGQKWRSMGNICWYTNLDSPRRHQIQTLYKRYNPEEYPTYDNYDAIEVEKTAEIPYDYPGVMGVPITFLNNHNPEQFEIVGITKTWFGGAKKTYPRQIQVSPSGAESTVTKLNDGAAIKLDKPPVKTYYRVDDEIFRQAFARILIRNLASEPAKNV